MDAQELRRLLNDGIQAARTDDRPRARACLLRVLDADDRNEPAWLWLSAVLDDPADQLMALEHVLAINPLHAEAQTQASALRAQLGLTRVAPQAAIEQPVAVQVDEAATAPIVAAPAAEAAAQYDTLSFEDDPYQCAYCGRPTRPDDERCRHCGRSLLAPGPWRGGGYLYLGLIVTGLQLQSALVQALASYLVTIYPQVFNSLPISWLLTSSPLLPALLRAIAWAIVVVLLLGEYDGSYGLAGLVALLDLAWAAAGFRLGYLPRWQAELNGGPATVILLIGLMATISQAQSRQRLRVVPDRGLASAALFHQRALAYARQGKWALAALHWRRAISRAPAEPLYYKSLGRADVRLGRYAEAVRAFKSGAEAAPDDLEFARLIEQVRAHARSS